MKVKSESEVVQSCPTLSDLMDCNLPGSSISGIFQARVLEWGAIAFSATLFYFTQNSVSTFLFSTGEQRPSVSSMPNVTISSYKRKATGSEKET